MARYFDPAVPADLAMLPKEYQGKSELDAIAQDAEADVINVYSLPEDLVPTGTDGYRGTRVFVCLAGYNPDAAQAEAELRAALKRSVRDAILWKIAQRDKNPLVLAQMNAGGISHTFRKDANVQVPREARNHLRTFDTTPPTVGI